MTELDINIKLANKILKAIPFCKFMGVEVHHLHENTVGIHFDNKPELIGNHIQGILHGGVIAAALDTVGGLIVMVTTYKKMPQASFDEQIEKFSKTSTIDCRVDYLTPGRGKHFLASANLLRYGNKVCVARMELHNDEDTLIALGTGTYLLG